MKQANDKQGNSDEVLEKFLVKIKNHEKSHKWILEKNISNHEKNHEKSPKWILEKNIWDHGFLQRCIPFDGKHILLLLQRRPLQYDGKQKCAKRYFL